MADMWAPMAGPAMVPGGAGSFAPTLPQGFETAPPNGPEEEKSRAGGWAKVQAFMQNPDMQMALLKMGLTMMQPVPVNQTPAGHVANAIGSSVDYLGAIQQQRLLQERMAAQITGQKAQTEAVQADTRFRLPAEVNRIQATTKEIESQTSRRDQLLPSDLKKAAQELALLEWQVKDAPTVSKKRELEAKKAELELKLEDQYGSRAKEAELLVKEQHAKYYDALANAQNALTKKYENDSSQTKGWTTKSQVEKEDGKIITVQAHADGRMRQVIQTPGMSIADAKAQAERDVKAMDDAEFASTYPGLSKSAAIAEYARQLRQPSIKVQETPAPGGTVQPQGTSGATPASPVQAARLPIPESMKDKPDGSTIDAKPDSPAARVSPTWVKKGGVLVPASPDDITRSKKALPPGVPEHEREAYNKVLEATKRGQPLTVEAPPAPQSTAEPQRETKTVKGVQNVPVDVPEAVVESYSRTVRGSKRFDHEAYTKDMNELKDLLLQQEQGTVPKSALRVRILRERLGIKTDASEPQKKLKFSMNVRKGATGKIEGLDVEEV